MGRRMEVYEKHPSSVGVVVFGVVPKGSRLACLYGLRARFLLTNKLFYK